MTAEIPERAAPPAIAAVYADIRATLDVAMVNRVWRHLATAPGALPLCWGLARPLYADGSAAAAAQRLRAMPDWPSVEPLAPDAFADAGVDAATRALLGALLAAYDHANPLNLLVLTALRERFAGRPVALSLAAVVPVARVAATLDVPPVVALALDAMDAGTRARVLALNAFGGTAHAADTVLATVLRQLADWPALLAQMHARVEPCMAEGTAERLVGTLREAVRHEATLLAARLPVTGAGSVDPAVAGRVAAMLGPFIDGTLLRMVALVPLLRRTLGD